MTAKVDTEQGSFSTMLSQTGGVMLMSPKFTTDKGWTEIMYQCFIDPEISLNVLLLVQMSGETHSQFGQE